LQAEDQRRNQQQQAKGEFDFHASRLPMVPFNARPASTAQPPLPDAICLPTDLRCSLFIFWIETWWGWSMMRLLWFGA
jgi:hypothetical protein